jgi:hypothetical protein
MAAALATWLATVLAYALTPPPGRRALSRLHSWARIGGRGALTAALILYPAATTAAVSLLYCTPVEVSARSLGGLDGGHSSAGPLEVASAGGAGAAGYSYGATATVSTLASDPFVLCWATGGSHRPAGALAVVTLVFYIAGFPLAALAWLLRDAALRVARHDPQQQQQFQERGKSRRWSLLFKRRRSAPLQPLQPNPGAAATAAV